MTCHDNPSLSSIEALDGHDHHHYGFSHSKMWAQYAENHAGICLLFDGKQLDGNLNKDLGGHCKVFRGFVKYDYEASVRPYPVFDSDIIEYGVTEGVRNGLFKFYKKNFLFKSPEWKADMNQMACS